MLYATKDLKQYFIKQLFFITQEVYVILKKSFEVETMDKYELFFKNGEYQKIVDELEFSINPQEIWLVVDAYVQLNQLDKAIRTIENNRELLLKDDAKKTMFLNIDLLLLTNDFVRALTAYSYYEELPYISIEIEEFLPELKKYIYQKISNKTSKMSDDEIINNLKNFDHRDLFLKSIYEVQKRDIKPFLPFLKDALKSEKIDNTIKSLILVLLVEKKVEDEVKVNKNGCEYTLIPRFLDPIITTKEIETIVYRHIKDKDVSILNLVNQLMVDFALKIYPDNFLEESEEEYLMAFYILAYEMFNKDVRSIEAMIKEKKLNIQTIRGLKTLIENTIKNL